MENINLTSLIEDDSNFLSTGYLEDALIEFSLRFKRLRRHSNQFAPHFSDDLSYWSNWTSNYSTQSEEGFSHASLLTHDVHYSSGDKTESTLKEISEEIINYQETKTLLLEEAISSSILDMSPCFNNYTGLGYSSDTYSIDSSSVDGRFQMLHRLAMVMAIPGLSPACLAKGERMTAHKHLGAVLINTATFEQHGGGTRALTFWLAPKHGLKLAAAACKGVLPHAPAALPCITKALDASKKASIKALLTFFIWLDAICIFMSQTLVLIVSLFSSN